MLYQCLLDEKKKKYIYIMYLYLYLNHASLSSSRIQYNPILPPFHQSLPDESVTEWETYTFPKIRCIEGLEIIYLWHNKVSLCTYQICKN